MLTCFICGQDASGGWAKGFVPGPDTQKLALCQAHDTPENRAQVVHEWSKLMEGAYQGLTQTAILREERDSMLNPDERGSGKRNIPRQMQIRFMAGGYVTLPCVRYEATAQGTLEVETPEGAVNSYPLQHVKSYELAPPSGASAVASGEVEEKNSRFPRPQSTLSSPVRTVKPPKKFDDKASGSFNDSAAKRPR